ncbi:MAG: Uma2 family endonuclease [Planctomycetota bacterium]
MSIGFVREKQPVLFRWTTKQYHRLIQSGVLTEDDPVELLEGFLVEKMPHNPPHDSTLSRLHRLLGESLPAAWILRNQSAVTLGNSEPEPDLTVAHGPDERYEVRHPGPKDITLIVEISDTTLSVDRERKGRIYARAGIPTYWIVNVAAGSVEVYTNPLGGRKPHYQSRADCGPGDHVTLTLGDSIVRLAVKEIVPRSK